MLILDHSDKEKAIKDATHWLIWSPISTKNVSIAQCDLKNMAIVFLTLVNGKHPYSEVANVIRDEGVEASEN